MTVSAPQPEPAPLTTLTRKPDRGAGRAELDDVLDTAQVGVLSTVLDGWPWSIPMLFARVGDDLLFHGSSGAGALRQVAAGAPITFTVFTIDGLVVAPTLFDHSANYRSAVIRGHATPVTAGDADAALLALSDKLIPGRVAETPANTKKEIAATVMLRLPIVEGSWLVKARTGGPGIDTDVWTGVVPMRTVYDEPVTYTGADVPASVRRLVE